MNTSEHASLRSAVAGSPLVQDLARSWWLLVVYGLVAIGFGLFALFRPAAVTLSLTWIFGFMALIEGVFAVIALFTGKHALSKGWQVVYALASLALGVITIANPVATAGVLVMFLAAWLIVGGIYRIAFAIRVRKQITGEWLIALSGVLAILIGVMFAMSPLVGLAAVGLWIGIGALLYGIVQLVAGFKLRSLKAD